MACASIKPTISYDRQGEAHDQHQIILEEILVRHIFILAIEQVEYAETAAEDNISIKRKKMVLPQLAIAGTREIDLLLGRFADAHMAGSDEEKLGLYDRFLNNSDPDIFNWISGQEPLPPAEDNIVVRLLLDFYKQK